MNSILRRWLPEAEKAIAPKVDCNGCSMAVIDQQNSKRWHDYKCCTFQPFFPNFYLGAMLESGIAIPQNQNVTFEPIGMFAAKEFRDRHAKTPDRERGSDLLCAAYDRVLRKCSVWELRPGECSSYFCQENQTELALKTYKVESAVAQMALIYQGFLSSDVEMQVESMENGEPSLHQLSLDDFEEFYLRTWKWAKKLSANEVQSWIDR